jgi:hypothetical protein
MNEQEEKPEKKQNDINQKSIETENSENLDQML